MSKAAYTHDVIVAGAGIVGISTALHLQQRGRRAALIDRLEPGEATSHGNTGTIEPSSILPYAFPKFRAFPRILMGKDTAAIISWPDLPWTLPWITRLWLAARPARRLESARAIRGLLDHCVSEHLALVAMASAQNLVRGDGWLKIWRSQAGFEGDAMTRRMAKEFGVNFDILTPQEALEIEPHLKPAYHRVLWWKDSVRVLNPGQLAKQYAKAFAAAGGSVLRGNALTLSQSGGFWRIQTAAGEISAPEAVVALGPWSMDVLKPLHYRLPLGVKRGYHQHFKARGNVALTRSFVDLEKGYCLAPMEMGYRLTTGAEFARRDAPPNPRQIGMCLPLARELFELGDAAHGDAWMGSRPCMPDSLPVIGPAPGHSGLWFNFGQGHLGLTLGPVSGKLLAQMMTGQAPFTDPSPYRATRF